MKRAQLTGIAIAGTAGLLAFIMVQGLVDKPQIEKTVEVHVKSSEVLVAAADIGLGQSAAESQLRWQPWPEETATTGYITRASAPNALTQMSGAIARAPIMAGEPITTQKLIKAGQGGVLAAILPAGMRAVSTKIKLETSAGGLIMPNDRVDVILIQRVKGRNGAEDYVSDTLLSNVRVLAIGQEIETKEGKRVADSSASTATLELTPRQSEILALGSTKGELTLSLRSISDLDANGAGPSAGDALERPMEARSIGVTRYGVSSRAFGMN
jgi:pilus assembly protein CpaB